MWWLSLRLEGQQLLPHSSNGVAGALSNVSNISITREQVGHPLDLTAQGGVVLGLAPRELSFGSTAVCGKH